MFLYDPIEVEVEAALRESYVVVLVITDGLLNCMVGNPQVCVLPYPIFSVESNCDILIIMFFPEGYHIFLFSTI